MYIYDELKQILLEKGIQKTDLVKDLGLSSRTVAKIAKNEKLSDRTLDRIATYLDTDVHSLYHIEADNLILRRLRTEKETGSSGGLYHELQVRMAYNSNHIEGSMLTEEQTRMIYETRSLLTDIAIPTDDILETIHHFSALNYVIDRAEEPLTEDIIKNIHFILKRDTTAVQKLFQNAGEYKREENTVGGRETTPVKDVNREMKNLLKSYHSLQTTTLEDIISFHVLFERIHPFDDGNGRVGRLVALKECLHHNIIPFLIEDQKKAYYYRGLSKWNENHGWLIDTCKDGQDTFIELLDMLKIPY
ncbi:MAG: Fic family protein [Solobacterium sp.]|nr:Fic family protein [Solobacterium sp.]